MNRVDSLTRRLSLAVVRFSAHLLPTERAEWAAAMIAEVRHCDGDGDAVGWALGCVIAALKERISSMVKGNLRVSTWVAVPEMLLCFAPLTIACVDAVRTLSGMPQHPAPGGSSAVAILIMVVTLAAIGPVGLIGAFRLLFNAKPIRARWLRVVVVAGPILNGVVLIGSQAFDFWSGLVLLSVLPALGAAHLIHLSSDTSTKKSNISARAY